MSAQAWITLLLGLPSLVLAFGTWRQRNANDARDQWWKRATWAVDSAGQSSESEDNGDDLNRGVT